MINYNNKTNDTVSFKRGNYVSFNSANPFKYNPYAYKLKGTIRLERGIVEDFKDGTWLSVAEIEYPIKRYTSDETPIRSI